jgi:hypothetical protein
MGTLIVNQYLSKKLWTPNNLDDNLVAWYSAESAVAGEGKLLNLALNSSVPDMTPNRGLPSFTTTGFNGFPSVRMNNNFLRATANVDVRQIIVTCKYDFAVSARQYSGSASTSSLFVVTSATIGVNTWISFAGVSGNKNGNYPLISLSGTQALPMSETIWAFNLFSGEPASASYLTIGTDRNFTGRIWNGDICDVIYLENQLTEEEYYKATGYLAHKRNLTANLPVTHPYKNTPPYA